MRAQHSDGRSAYQAEYESTVFEGVGHGEYAGPETALDQMQQCAAVPVRRAKSMTERRGTFLNWRFSIVISRTHVLT